jgi:RHS repeat-associated protein
VQENGPGGTATLLTGLDIDTQLMRTDGTGSAGHLTDALGSTIALADAAGAVTTSYTFEPFGTRAQAGAASANPFEYTGRESDGTGLYYYRARYYHPGLQRFLSEDPLEFATGDTNRYGYVANNPLLLTDPLGLDKECAGAELSNSTPLQALTDISAGFGDGLSLHATELIRKAAGIDAPVRKNCGLYRAAEAAGYGWLVAINVTGVYTGHEFRFGKDWRLAPWGNRRGNPYGEPPHYHRRGAPGPDGKTPPGQGIGRHRPFEPSQHDTRWWDRF